MMRRFFGNIWSSSQPTIKQEAAESEPSASVSDVHEEYEATNDVDMDVDMEDMIAIAKAERQLEGSVELEEASESPKVGKKEKKGRKTGRKGRKSLDLVEEPENEGEGYEQLGGRGWERVNRDVDEEIPQLVEVVEETVNTGLDGTFDDQEYAETPKRRGRSSGTSKKRTRKSTEADAPFEPEGTAPAEEAEEEVPMVVETKSAKNKGRNTRSRKSRNALVEEDTNEDEPADLKRKNSPPQQQATQDISEVGEESIPADLADLPKKLRRAKRKAKISPHKTMEVIINAAAEDDNDSAAALHSPLTPAHIDHHRTNSNSHEEAAAKLQEDAQSNVSAGPEDELETTPKKPSKKALGKRKASDFGANTSKRRKKDNAAGTPELTSYGFSLSSEPQRRATPMFTPINRPRASILPPSAQIPPVDPLADDDSDEYAYVPEVPAPKSSERKKKRRLPVGDDEPNPKTPQNKGSRKPKTPKSDAKTPQPKAPATTGKGRLSNEEVEAITHAVEGYRDQNDLTQAEMNDLIHKDGKTDGMEFWKYIYEEIPDIPRRQIQQMCRRKFHNFEARGSWTEEQDQEFREAYEKYPNKWKQIGQTINRFPEDCRDRWRNYLVCGDNMRKDAWDKEEEERLKEVVQECIEMVREMKRVSTDPRDKAKSDESLVDWIIVSQKMDHTRSRLQCIQKWKKIKDREEVVVDDPVLAKPISETWRIEGAEHVARKMKAKEKLLLLYAVRESGAGREGKIPWKRVREEVPGKPLKMAMRVAFRQMRQHIEDNEDMALQDIVDLLIDAFEASVPSEPPRFDDDFERFRSSQKLLSKKKKRKSKGEAEAEVVSSSDDNGEGPSTISKSKRKTRLSDKYVVDKDNEEDDVYAIPQDEQPTKSKRRKTASSLPAEDNQVGSSATKNKRKLRERMKSIGQSQSQSQERDDQRHSEVSDVHTALETLKTGNSRARRAAAKEATKAKGKPFLSKEVLSEERVVESDEEEQPLNEEPSPVRAAKAKRKLSLGKPFPSNEPVIESDEEEQPAEEATEAKAKDGRPSLSEERSVESEEEEAPVHGEEQSANEDMEVDEEEPLVDEEQLSVHQEPLANGELSEHEEGQSANEEEPPVTEESSENEEEPPDNAESSENEHEPSANEDLEADEDEMDLDKHDTTIAPDGSEADEEEPRADEETQSENEDELPAKQSLGADEDAMDVDYDDTYTAPGGPEAEDDESSFEDEEDEPIHHDQDSADLHENEDEEENTHHHDTESVDLDATRNTSANEDMEVDEDEPPVDEEEPTTNGVHEENENENQGSDAETDFHGFQDAASDAGSVELGTPVQMNHEKRVQPPEVAPKVNGFTNGHRQLDEEERVSSDDDDMSDIPAKIAPKAKFVEHKKEKKPKKEKKSKSKKKRPVGFR